MFIYLLLLMIIFIIFKISKNKNRALVFSFLLIAIVASLRKYTVGVDTKQFYDMFDYIHNDLSWNYHNFRYEPGFYYLCKLLSKISSNAQILIIVSSVFINFSVYRFIKNNSPDFQLSTILYIIMLFFFSTMNIMRQALALSILLYGFDFLKEKKYFKYIITVFIAGLFHTVSFAGLLLLFFSILPNKKIVYIIEIFLAAITFIFYEQFFKLLTFGFGYESYATSKYGVSNYFGALIAAIEILLIIIFLVLASYKKGKKINSSSMKLLTITSILYIWFEFLVVRMNIFNRVAGLFGIYTIIFIPLLLEHMKEYNKDNYFISKSICCILLFASFLIISIFRPEWHGVIPYEFFWN